MSSTNVTGANKRMVMLQGWEVYSWSGLWRKVIAACHDQL